MEAEISVLANHGVDLAEDAIKGAKLRMDA
jgi:hypothetical protein